MWRQALASIRTSRWTSVRSAHTVSQQMVTIHPEVRSALALGCPVIAMESTIVTHGMPYPENVRTALGLEEIMRSYDVTPATIGIIDGQVVVGLTPSQLERLGTPLDHEKRFKVSRRDLAYVLSQGYSGGTTVSGTMVCAHKVGIPLFVTGGIGGVHRHSEQTLDVSADLTELGRTPLGVVCAGAKSILDIGRTLEYLETQGVTVASYGETKDFPAFFSPKSGFEAPYSINNPVDAAKLIDTNLTFGVQSGVLIGVPVPSSAGSVGDEIEEAIQQALVEAKERRISGKSVTPFLLERVNHLTSGKSLKANIELIENNARVGSKIAVELAKLRKKGSDKIHTQVNYNSAVVRDADSRQKSDQETNCRKKGPAKVPKQAVVVGASILDFSAKINSTLIKHEGTNPGNLTLTYGGVGRNIAECMTRLGYSPFFISSLGRDESGGILARHFKQTRMSLEGMCESEQFPTATYCVVLDNKGELFCAIGDMDVNQCVSVDWVKQFTKQLSEAPLVCVDGNVPNDTIEFVCNFCSDAGIPVWFEPTCIDKSAKPFLANCHSKITYTSPNLSELRNMCNTLTNKPINTALSSELTTSEKLSECLELVPPILSHIPNVFVSLGKDGLLCCSAHGPKYLHYPPAASHLLPVDVISVTGAGDSFVGATIVALIHGLTLDLSVKAGLRAAYNSVRSHHAVCSKLSQEVMTEESINEWASWEPRAITPVGTGV